MEPTAISLHHADLPPSLQHKGAIREGKADFSQPDTYCTRIDVRSRIHHYHLQKRNTRITQWHRIHGNR